MIEERGRCKTCGTHDWQFPNEGIDAKIVVDAYVCYGCELVEREKDRRKDDADHHGLKLGFFPIEE